MIFTGSVRWFTTATKFDCCKRGFVGVKVIFTGSVHWFTTATKFDCCKRGFVGVKVILQGVFTAFPQPQSFATIRGDLME